MMLNHIIIIRLNTDRGKTMKSKIISIIPIFTFSFPLISFSILILAGVAGASPFAYITNVENNNVSVIDISNNTIVTSVDVGQWPTGVAANPDGTKVYVANSGSNNVYVIDTVTNKVIDTAYVGSCPLGVAVNPDGTKVYVTNSASNTISVIDTATNDVTATVNVGNIPAGIAVAPDGKKVYVENFGKNPDYNGTISVIDTATNNVTDTVKVESAPQGIAVSPDGTKVYVVNSNKYPYYKGTISVIDTATNDVTETINIGSCPQGIAVNPNGTRVYVAIDNPGVYSHTVNVDVTSHIGAVNVIDTATNEVIETVNVESTPKGIAVTPDGNKVYVVNYGSNTTSVINTATNKVDATVPVGEYPIAVGLSPVIKSSSTMESNSTSLLNLINRTENQTNDTEAAANAETVSTQKIESSSNKASIPFISPIWALVAVLGAVACIRKTK